MRYKLIVFDFDGTLADSLPWAASVVNQFADQYGFRRIHPDEHDFLRGFEARNLMQHLGVPMWKVPIMAVHVRSLMAQHLDEIPRFPGVDEALAALHAGGAILAVVSSNSEHNVRTVLGPAIAGLIAYYECGASVFGKAGKLTTVLHKSKVAPAEAILIGDEIRDCDAARKVHMAFGAVAWGYTKLNALEAQAPDEVFHDVAEIGQRLA